MRILSRRTWNRHFPLTFLLKMLNGLIIITLVDDLIIWLMTNRLFHYLFQLRISYISPVMQSDISTHILYSGRSTDISQSLHTNSEMSSKSKSKRTFLCKANWTRVFVTSAESLPLCLFLSCCVFNVCCAWNEPTGWTSVPWWWESGAQWPNWKKNNQWFTSRWIQSKDCFGSVWGEESGGVCVF